MQTLIKSGKYATEIRQAELIDAAVRLAAQRSPTSITTGDLAQAVGITQGAMFRHFDSKHALWLTVLVWVRGTLMQRLQEAASQAIDGAVTSADTTIRQAAPVNPLAALRAVFMAHVEFVVMYPGVPRIIFQELQQAQDSALLVEVQRLMQQYRALLMQLLEQAKSSQLIATNTDTTSASMLFIGSIQGLVMQSLMSGDVAAMRQQAPAVYALVQRGLQVTDHSLQGNP